MLGFTHSLLGFSRGLNHFSGSIFYSIHNLSSRLWQPPLHCCCCPWRPYKMTMTSHGLASPKCWGLCCNWTVIFFRALFLMPSLILSPRSLRRTSTATKAVPFLMACPGFSECQAPLACYDPFMPSKLAPTGWSYTLPSLGHF
jgi:hypothetical protein